MREQVNAEPWAEMLSWVSTTRWRESVYSKDRKSRLWPRAAETFRSACP